MNTIPHRLTNPTSAFLPLPVILKIYLVGQNDLRLIGLVAGAGCDVVVVGD